MESALFNTYNRSELSVSHGTGVWLWDHEEHQFLDATSGLGVNILGHAHPTFVTKVQEQVGKLIHVSNAFQIPEQEALAKKLTQLTGLDKAFICNTGSEANETALKLTRLYAKQKGIKNPSVVVMEGAFHGRTLATLSASSSRKVQAGFEPLVQGFVRAPFNDYEALTQIAGQREDIVAIMLEPIQGYGGVLQASADYLKKIRQLCDKKGWLLIADEIQSGMGRTGQFLSMDSTGLKADIVTLAKGLGGGIPIGACLANKKLGDLFTPGSHGTTFGGNPLACTAALCVLDILESENLLSKVQTHSELLISTLRETLTHPCVKDIRGKGFMIGIELNKDALAVKQEAKLHGLIIDVTANHVIRLLPPFILSKEEIHLLCQKLSKALTNTS